MPPSIQLRPVTVKNRGDLEDINPGDPQRYWVHSNWYWHQQSLDNPKVLFRLVHSQGAEAAVGMVAYGPAYRDEALTLAMPGTYEIIHLVIDEKHQRQSLGRRVAETVLESLFALPDCERVVVATHPDNRVSAAFFGALGFEATGQKNYDGDPMLERQHPKRLGFGTNPTPTMTPAPIKPNVTFADLEKLDVRVGAILEVSDVERSEKLVRLRVDFGDHRRNILVGLKKERANPREIVGQQALFVVNLEPRRMAGEVSEGMLFDIGYADGLRPVLAQPETSVPAGTRVG